MSVPVPKRHSGELEVNVCTRELCLYTLRILENEKIFPASQAYIIQEIRETVLDIHTTCWEANNIKVSKNMVLFEQRTSMQIHAGNACNKLYALIEIAKPLFHLRSSKASYWQSLVVKTRNKIRAWYDSDAKRLNPTRDENAC